MECTAIHMRKHKIKWGIIIIYRLYSVWPSFIPDVLWHHTTSVKLAGFNILKRYVTLAHIKVLALQHLLHISTSSVDACSDLVPPPPKRLIVKKCTRKWDPWNWIVSKPNILRFPRLVNFLHPHTFEYFKFVEIEKNVNFKTFMICDSETFIL